MKIKLFWEVIYVKINDTEESNTERIREALNFQEIHLPIPENDKQTNVQTNVHTYLLHTYIKIK